MSNPPAKPDTLQFLPKQMFRKRMLLFFAPVSLVYIIWFIYMMSTGGWKLFVHYYYMTITMVAGSFIAGSSSEGGGAVAFPVMTLLFKVHPAEARNFTLAIQSIGMTAATLWIISKRIKIEKKYLLYAIIGGLPGIVFGSYFIAPYTSPPYAKMLFVSFWLSFGIALFVVNRFRKRDVHEQLPQLSASQKIEMIIIGAIGGMLSSIVGTGINICTFSYVTMKYRLSEKIATPTSVILMAADSIMGFLLHLIFMKDIEPVVFSYWKVCIPVVMIGAPLGAFVASKVKKVHLVYLLCTVILAQFIGAILILHPTGKLLYFSIASFLAGIIIFFMITKKVNKGGVPYHHERMNESEKVKGLPGLLD